MSDSVASCRCILLLSFVFGTICSKALSADDSSEFARWKESQRQAFNEFQTAEDRAFVQFLDKEWRAFQRFKGMSRDQVPKPAVAPRISNSAASLPSFEAVQSNGTVSGGQDSGARGKLPANTFFGLDLPALQLPEVQLPDLSQPDGPSISALWQLLSSSDHKALVDGLSSAVRSNSLGDWGALQLCAYVVQKHYADPGQQTAYVWFLMNRLGLDLRLGYDDTGLWLLMPASVPVYANSFIQLNEQAYYLLQLKPEARETGHDRARVVTANGVGAIRAHEQASAKSLRNFSLETGFGIRPSGETRGFRVASGRSGASEPAAAGDADRPDSTIELEYDAGRGAFLATYPQIDLQWYFASAPGQPTFSSLQQAFTSQLARRSERDAINYLLRFVQFSFAYETDQDQFGRERYLMAEESLNYAANDCEDRSIFLAWLVHSLLRLDVVVLDYPGHVAMAVRTNLQPNDEYVVYDKQKYVVIDPTYIGATAGMVMPAVASVQPDIFPTAYGLGNGRRQDVVHE